LIAAAFMLFFRLSSTDLWAPDEPRFAAVAEELRSFEHGPEGLVVLHLNGAPYTQKPPLYYWMAALLGALPGRVTELAARLPSALAGLGCIWLTIQFGTALTRRPAVGLISGAVLLTVFRFAHLARRAQLDIVLTFFVMLALYALFQLRQPDAQDATRREGRRWFYLLHTALALAVLTKGPVALLPIPAFALYLSWQGQLRTFRQVFPLRSFVISLGPAIAWMALAISLAPAGFFDQAVVQNLFGRFFSGTAHVRPFAYFFYHFPLEFLPWSMLWPWVGIHLWRTRGRESNSAQRDGTRLLIVWVAVCFCFFSLSAGKRGLYLLPTYPAVAILCGVAIDAFLARRDRWPRILWAALAGLALLAFGFGAFIWQRGGLELQAYPGFALPQVFGSSLVGIALVSLIAGATLILRGAPSHRQLGAPLAGIYLLEVLVFAVAYPAFDDEKSPRPISQAAAALSESEAPIGVFDHRALAGGVAYYSGHRVVNLRSEKSLREFLDRGGRSIIVKQSKLDRIPAVTEFEVRAFSRSGRRRLVVLNPAETKLPPVAGR
jgi:4-amino-4-deoxy-L-arabinose transferase-like glycosyltransferase